MNKFKQHHTQANILPSPLLATTIGILTAMPIEARCLTSKRVQIRETIALSPSTFLHITGMGPECARRGAKQLLAQGAEVLISWGVAGGLDPQVSPGQLIMPSHILDQHANMFQSDHLWRQHFHRIFHRKLDLMEGLLLQDSEIVTSLEIKQALFAQHKAIAVDMESGTIAHVAHEARIPFLAIRAIVDSATVSLPHWFNACLNAKKQIVPLKFMGYVCRYPNTLLPLIYLSQHFSKARNTLALAAHLTGWKKSELQREKFKV